MTRIIVSYGLISGLVSIFGILGTFLLPGAHESVLLGYLIMLVALSSILVAVKQHRDQALGGVIRFWPALGLGLAIALLAGVTYVLVWEGYEALHGYSFMKNYTAQMLAAKRAAGVTGEAYAKFAAEMAAMEAQYANPLYRMAMIFMEIFPVGFLVALVSAALMRNPKFLPARSRATAAA